MDKEEMVSLMNSAGLVTGGGGLNWANLIGGFIFGMIGLVAFMYGKKEKSAKPMGIGVALMAYPYFISNTIALYIVGTALSLLLYFWRD